MENKVIQRQVIDADGGFILDNNAYLSALPSDFDRGSKLFTVSVIGGQSSGKSTLLNALFHTDFNVLDAKTAGRCQTTKGVWLALLPQNNIIVYDIEGVDSRERWEEGEGFAKSTALFALVLSNLVMINIWTTDIGKYQASHYQLLKTIFEINFRLFQDRNAKENVDRKKLMFVFRDFDSEHENLERICQMFEEDISKIWKDMTKPQEFELYDYQHFFEVLFVPLSSYRRMKQAFESEVSTLRERFLDSIHPTYMFQALKQNSDVPLDGLQNYIARIWKKIRDCKDLDLPNQKILMAMYRCKEIKKEIYESIITPQIQEIDRRLTENIYLDLASDSCKVYNTAIEKFNQQTKYYDAEEADKHREEIISDLNNYLTSLLKKQLGAIQKYAKKQLKMQIDKIGFEDVYFNNFDSYANASKEALKHEIFKMIDLSKTSEVQYNTDSFKNEIHQEILDAFDSHKKMHLEKFVSHFLEKQIAGPVIENIKSLFRRLEVDFWLKFNGFYLDFYMQKEASFQKILIKSYGKSPEQAKELAMELRTRTEKIIEEQIQYHINNLNFIKDAFDNRFVRSENGTVRVWSEYSVEEVDEIYRESLDYATRLTMLFEYLEILDYEKSQKEKESKQTEVEKACLGGVEVIENKNFKPLCSPQILDQKVKAFAHQAKSVYDAAYANSQRSQTLARWLLGYGKSVGKSIVKNVIAQAVKESD